MKKDTMRKMRESCKETKTMCEFCEDFYDVCNGKNFNRFCYKNDIKGIPSEWTQKDINKGK